VCGSTKTRRASERKCHNPFPSTAFREGQHRCRLSGYSRNTAGQKPAKRSLLPMLLVGDLAGGACLHSPSGAAAREKIRRVVLSFARPLGDSVLGPGRIIFERISIASGFVAHHKRALDRILIVAGHGAARYRAHDGSRCCHCVIVELRFRPILPDIGHRGSGSVRH